MSATGAAQPGAIEKPSGKGAADENFPVGSWLLPGRLRPHVATYYAFARAADDISDDSELPAPDKVARLARLAQALRGESPGDEEAFKAHRLRESMAATGVPVAHGLDLLAAFTQDATKLRYASWGELMAYCRLSASPVGRYLLDLHGEDKGHWWASDALCDALQVINHLQDCKADRRTLDRVYLPLDWLAEAGTGVEALDAPAASAALRRVLDRCIDGTEALLAKARHLPGLLRSRHLAAESAIIVRIAERLCAELRRRDPLAERVALTKPQLLSCGLAGAWDALVGRRLPPASAPAP